MVVSCYPKLQGSCSLIGCQLPAKPFTASFEPHSSHMTNSKPPYWKKLLMCQDMRKFKNGLYKADCTPITRSKRSEAEATRAAISEVKQAAP